MVALINGQYEMNGIVFGEGTKYPTQPLELGAIDIVTQDALRPRVDGMTPGRDTFGGRTLVFDMGVHSEALDDDLEDLELAWRNDAIRQTPGAVVPLRYRRRGRDRVIYGRPRKFAVTLGGRKAQFYNVVAEFVQVDSFSYGDVEHQNTVNFVPPEAGGLEAPLMAPLSTVALSSSPGVIFVGGKLPAWLRIVIHGPITRPEIDIVGKWKIRFTDLVLAFDEYVEINPTPGNRYIRKNGVVNLGGALTADSPYMSQMIVPPGEQELVLRGVDITGTSYMQVFWRESYGSF